MISKGGSLSQFSQDPTAMAKRSKEQLSNINTVFPLTKPRSKIQLPKGKTEKEMSNQNERGGKEEKKAIIIRKIISKQ